MKWPNLFFWVPAKERPGSSPVRLTEAMWFDAQLGLIALKADKVHPYSVRYHFDSEGEPPIRCWVGIKNRLGLSPSDLDRVSKVRSLTVPRREEVERLLDGMPGLSAEINVDKDLVVDVVISTDYVDSPVCRVYGDSIEWFDESG